MANTRNRRIGSLKNTLLDKGRESALTAVQVFNNPLIKFKSETFIVLMMISWTYLMHAYFKSQGIDYRYFEQQGQRRKFGKTRHGAYKHWSLEDCINNAQSPLDKATKANLFFLLGLRHEIEHQMSLSLDQDVSSKLHACCLNFNNYIVKLFGIEWGIEKHLAYSINFSQTQPTGTRTPKSNVPAHIQNYIKQFEDGLEEDIYGNQAYALRMLLFQKVANRKGQADQVIEFIDPSSEMAKGLESQYYAIKDREKPKFRPKDIVNKMKEEGFAGFTISQHTKLWQSKDAQNPAKKFGVEVSGQWYWYENWLTEVRNYCQQQGRRARAA